MGTQWVLGLDIGTSSIKLILAEEREGKPLVRMVHREPSAGVRKGTIVDLPEVSSALARAFGEVRNISRSALGNIYVGVGTHQTRAQASRGIVAVSRADNEIYEDDVERVIKASQSVVVQPNRVTIHNVTREYIIDGVGDILEPLGLSGSRLEVQSVVIDAFAPHVKNITRIVELAGGRIGSIVANPIAAARAALSKKQKELGVTLIDIGGGTTGVAVYEENKLLHAAIVPVGAMNVTNDLAMGLKIPAAAAETLKLHSGYALASDVSSKDGVDMRKFAPDGKTAVPRRFVAEIIEARLSEIFQLVNIELKSVRRAGALAGGAILVGGGARMPGISDLAKRELKLAVQIGSALPGEWHEHPSLLEYLEDPELVTAAGLVLVGAERSGWQGGSRRGVTGFFRNLFRSLLP